MNFFIFFSAEPDIEHIVIKKGPLVIRVPATVGSVTEQEQGR